MKIKYKALYAELKSKDYWNIAKSIKGISYFIATIKEVDLSPGQDLKYNTI